MIEDRQDIAAAVSTVPGITCSPYFEQKNMRPGTASVRLGRMQQADNGFGLVAVWEVWIVIGQDVAKAEKWIESHHDALVDALRDELVLISVTPADMVFGGPNSINGVIYEGTR